MRRARASGRSSWKRCTGARGRTTSASGPSWRAEQLHWHQPFSIALDDSDAPNYRWFCDGELNVSDNCLDVHLAERGHKTAIIFESEAGEVRRLSYRQLHAQVCRLANALKGQGVQRR